MDERYHYDAAFERIRDLQRESENARLMAEAYPPLGQVVWQRIGDLTVRAGDGLAAVGRSRVFIGRRVV